MANLPEVPWAWVKPGKLFISSRSGQSVSYIKCDGLIRTEGRPYFSSVAVPAPGCSVSSNEVRREFADVDLVRCAPGDYITPADVFSTPTFQTG